MKMKFCVLIAMLWSGTHAWAETLTQAEYDVKINEYTQSINQTKTILDQPEQQNDLKAQNLAFCERIRAYQNILKISEDNPQLERSMLMQTVAKMYLSRQIQSLNDSGMTQQVFCTQVTAPTPAID